MDIVVAPAIFFHPSGVISGDTIVYGDSDSTIGGHAAAQTFNYKADSSTIVIGDAETIERHGQGGDDHFRAVGVGNAELSLVCGDASAIADHAHGGDDQITGRGEVLAVTGDADILLDHSHGGDDRIVVRGVAGAAGDAAIMAGNAHGGDDRMDVYGSQGSVGDAYSMNDRSVGGNDYLHAFSNQTFLAGDAYELRAFSRGGDDVVIGSKCPDVLYGDASVSAGDHSVCGNDFINGGLGNDLFFGDAPEIAATARVGNDRFVFQAASGQDTIGDFQRGHDKIDVRQLGFDEISDLHITSNGTDSVVHFRGANQVTVLDVAHLHASDFLFA